MRDMKKYIVESAAVFFLGAALAAYSLIGFHTAAVQAAWLLSPYLFPLVLSGFVLLLSVSLFFEGRRQGSGTAERRLSAQDCGRVCAVIVLAVIYVCLLSVIRFLLATALFLAVFLWYLGERNYWRAALISVLTPLGLYAVFKLLLNVRLP